MTSHRPSPQINGLLLENLRATDQTQVQLSLYRLAYSRASGVPLADISAAFHYVASGETVWAEPYTEAQIEAQVGAAVEGFSAVLGG